MVNFFPTIDHKFDILVLERGCSNYSKRKLCLWIWLLRVNIIKYIPENNQGIVKTRDVYYLLLSLHYMRLCCLLDTGDKLKWENLKDDAQRKAKKNNHSIIQFELTTQNV